MVSRAERLLEVTDINATLARLMQWWRSFDLRKASG